MDRTSIKAKLFRKISSNSTDFTILLCSSSDIKHIPDSLKKSGKIYVTITGINLPVVDSIEIEYFGKWVKNKKYGLQFSADSYVFITPKTENGIKSYLKSKAFKGIGTKTAENIVNTFKEDTIDVIKNHPNKLLTISGITPNKVKIIHESFMKNESFSNNTIFLAEYGISTETIVKINDFLGDKTIEKIKENPYIIQDIKGIGFYTCDKIAKGLNTALDSYERIKGAVLEIINTFCNETGNTCISIHDLEEKTLRLLNRNISKDVVNSDIFRKVCCSLSKEDVIVFRKKQYVFLKSFDRAEQYSAEKILMLNREVVKTTPISVLSLFNEYTNKSELKLNIEQELAVKEALLNPVSIITGSAGTGKTSILKAIITLYRKLNPSSDIILLSPTGKASRRMEEATGEKASTIHSKLKLFENDSYEQVELNGLIVVDEASMLDNMLLYHILKSIRCGSNLVFIGDVNQIPSVGAGNVLYDLIKSNIIPVTRLTIVYRQEEGGSILDNAIEINRGNTNLRYDSDFSLELISNEDEAIDRIKELYQRETFEYGIQNVALLSPLRRTQNGRFKVVSDYLNKELQDAINPRNTDAFCVIHNTEYRVGDLVLEWKNTEFASNGDIGKILSIESNDDDFIIRILWDNGNTTEEERETMSDISLAYAISVHKSQGSQYQSVIIPLLSNMKCPLYNRKIIFTAITRAKGKVTIITDDKSIIDYCISNIGTNRKTLLKERLTE